MFASRVLDGQTAIITGGVLTVDGGQWLNRGTFGFLSLPSDPRVH
jgi:hypothetical protein